MPNGYKLLPLICWQSKILKKLKAELFYGQICAIFARLGSSTRGRAYRISVKRSVHWGQPRELKEAAGGCRRRESGLELREKQLRRPAPAYREPESSGRTLEALGRNG